MASSTSRESFTTQMRKATRDVHAVSDALVNAKLFFALSDNSVWAEGLLIFYEIFRFLEESMQMYKSDNVGRLFIDGMERTQAFEEDLKHYLGADWMDAYIVRDAVAEYLLYLRKLRDSNKHLLMAYIYHLYMGLLSGGQILKKKRQLKSKLLLSQDENSFEGNKVTDFGDIPIAELKRNLKKTMDEIAETLSDDEKTDLLAESRKVFTWNNKIISTVKGANRIMAQKIIVIIVAIVLLIILFRLFSR